MNKKITLIFVCILFALTTGYGINTSFSFENEDPILTKSNAASSSQPTTTTSEAVAMSIVGTVTQNTHDVGGGYNPNTNEFWYPELLTNTIHVYDQNHNFVRNFTGQSNSIRQLWVDKDSTTDYYIADFNTETFKRINAATNTVVWTHNNNNNNFFAGAISTDADYAYVLSYTSNEIDVLDKNTGVFVRSITLPGATFGLGLVVANGFIYIIGSVGDWSDIPFSNNSVHQFNMNGSYVTSIATSQDARNMAFDGEVMWISDGGTIIEGVKISNGNVYESSAVVSEVPVPVNDVATVDKNSTNTVIAVLSNDDFGVHGANATHPLTVSNGRTSGGSSNGGTITVNDNGTPNDLSDDVILYTPPADFTGTDMFQYTITDDDGNASTATVTITVVEGSIGNYTPTATDDTATVNADSGDNTIDVLNNDNFGVDGAIDGGLTMTNGTLTSASANSGDIRIDNKGTDDTTDDVFIYTPEQGFTGVDTFKYTITDASGDASTATVTVTVIVVADAPFAVDDVLTVDENSTATLIDVTANDSFGTDGTATSNSLTVTGSSEEGGTTAVVNNEVSYTPAADFAGEDSFEYTITDLNGDQAVGTVIVTVNAVDTPNGEPTAVADAETVVQNSSGNIFDVLANDDFGLDGANATHPLTVSNGRSFGASANGGKISVDANGTPDDLSDDVILYTAPEDFNGTDTFNYVITDASGDASTGTVTISVTSSVVPGAPFAVDDVLTVDENSTANLIDVVANDSFGTEGPATSNSLTVTGSSEEGGTTEVVNNEVSYTPAADFAGEDSFEYTITDLNGDQAVGTVIITVNAVHTPNGEPTAVADAETVVQNSSGNTFDVLANDDFGSDGASATHPLKLTNGRSSGASANGGKISVDANGTPNDLSDDVIIYTTPEDFNGTDTFNYVITDANGDASTATVTITVTASTEFYTPTATDDLVTVIYNSTDNEIDVLDNDTFGLDGAIDGGLTMTNGTLTSVSANSGAIRIDNKETDDTSDDIFIYTPEEGFSGEDTFQYTITDASGDASTATVTVTVSGPRTDVPTATDDAAAVALNSSSHSIDVISNDDFGSDGPATIPFLINSPDHITGTTAFGGAFALDENGTPSDATDDKVTYTPATGFTGVDSFQYTIKDLDGDESIGTVTITVGTVAVISDEPEAVDDNVSVERLTTVNYIDVMSNDIFGSDGPNLTHPLTLSNGRSTGTSAGGRFIEVNDNGTPNILSDDVVFYTPGSLTSDSFEYTITDGSGDATKGTVYITTTEPKVNNSMTLGTNTIFENSFLAYPNPSNGNVTITLLSSLETKATVMLFDVSGKRIYNSDIDLRQGANELNFNFNLPTGMMFMKITSSEVDFGISKIIFK